MLAGAGSVADIKVVDKTAVASSRVSARVNFFCIRSVLEEQVIENNTAATTKKSGHYLLACYNIQAGQTFTQIKVLCGRLAVNTNRRFKRKNRRLVVVYNIVYEHNNRKIKKTKHGLTTFCIELHLCFSLVLHRYF